MPAQPDVSTPVVVIRCARHGGLGITRTLGRMGVPIYNVDESKSAPAFYSRYSRGRFTWDAEKAPEEQTIAALSGLAGRIGRRAILVPTSDSTAMLVSKHASTLSQWFDFPHVDPSLVTGLCSKREMYFLATKFSVPTPDAAFPQSREELVEASKRMTYPLMAKGIFGIELERKSGKRMFLIHSRQQLFDLYDSYEDWGQPNIMLQEFIPGSDKASWMLNGYYDRDSNCLAEFTGRKLRQYPAYTGLTSLGECALNETVARTTREFMKACGYRGILDIGYRYDERDGQYKVMDINPRVGATFRLFVGSNGMDVIRAMYLDMTGQPVESAPALEGRRWLVEDCDLISSVRYLRDGKLAFKDWILSHRGVAETGVFALDDPMPAMWMGVRNVRKLWARKSGSNGKPGALS